MNKEEIIKQARIEFARSGAIARLKGMTKEQKSAHAKMMRKARKPLKNKDKKSG